MQVRGLDVHPYQDHASPALRALARIRRFGTPVIWGRVAGLTVVTVATLAGWVDLGTLALLTAIAVSLGGLEVRSLRSARSAALHTDEIDTAA